MEQNENIKAEDYHNIWNAENQRAEAEAEKLFYKAEADAEAFLLRYAEDINDFEF